MRAGVQLSLGGPRHISACIKQLSQSLDHMHTDSMTPTLSSAVPASLWLDVGCCGRQFVCHTVGAEAWQSDSREEMWLAGGPGSQVQAFSDAWSYSDTTLPPWNQSREAALAPFQLKPKQACNVHNTHSSVLFRQNHECLVTGFIWKNRNQMLKSFGLFGDSSVRCTCPRPLSGYTLCSDLVQCHSQVSTNSRISCCVYCWQHEENT